MTTTMTKIDSAGRIVIPAKVRKTLGVRSGDSVVLVKDDNGGIRILSTALAIREAQEMVRRRVPKGRSLVDELLKDRREEARRG